MLSSDNCTALSIVKIQTGCTEPVSTRGTHANLGSLGTRGAQANLGSLGTRGAQANVGLSVPEESKPTLGISVSTGAKPTTEPWERLLFLLIPRGRAWGIGPHVTARLVATGLHDLRHHLDIPLHGVQNRLRIKPQKKARRHDRPEGGPFAHAQVANRFVLVIWRLLQRPKEDGLDHAQKIPSAKDNAGRAQDGEHRAHLEDAEQYEGLADEAVEPRQTDATEADENHGHGQQAQVRPEAAEVAQPPRVITLVEHADQEEQGAGGQAVVNHLHQTARDAGLVEGKHAEHAKAQVADAAVGHQFLDVV